MRKSFSWVLVLSLAFVGCDDGDGGTDADVDTDAGDRDAGDMVDTGMPPGGDGNDSFADADPLTTTSTPPAGTSPRSGSARRPCCRLPTSITSRSRRSRWPRRCARRATRRSSPASGTSGLPKNTFRENQRLRREHRRPSRRGGPYTAANKYFSPVQAIRRWKKTSPEGDHLP